MSQQDIFKPPPIPNPSGEAFVGQFVLFINSTGWESAGREPPPLKIQPRALEYVARRLEALRNLQRLRSTDPMAFISGASRDLKDYKRLEKIQHFLEGVRHLKLHSAAKGVRDPTPVTLSPFSNIVTLELRGCDLSSQCIRGIGYARKTLEKLICSDSLEQLRHLLAPLQYERRGGKVTEEDTWPNLTHLSCQNNSITVIDSSLTLLPALTSLDLSNNHLTIVANIAGLVCLDLSHNQLTDLGDITNTCPHLEKLFCQGNRLRNIQDFVKLECLQVLDVRWNLVANLVDIVRVAQLPKLKDVGFEGNPLAVSPAYRVNVMSCFLDKGSDFILDGIRSSEVELRKSRKVRVTEAGEVLPVNPSERIVIPPRSFFRDIWNFTTRNFTSVDKSRRPSSPTSDQLSPERATPKKQHKPVRRVVDIPDAEDKAPGSGSSQEPTPTVSRYSYPERSAKSLSHSQVIAGTSSTGKIGTAWSGTALQADAFTLPTRASTTMIPDVSRVPYSVV